MGVAFMSKRDASIHDRNAADARENRASECCVFKPQERGNEATPAAITDDSHGAPWPDCCMERAAQAPFQ